MGLVSETVFCEGGAAQSWPTMKVGVTGLAMAGNFKPFRQQW